MMDGGVAVRSPVLDALDPPMDYDPGYQWWRYSKGAFVWVLAILLVSTTLLILSFWQAEMTIKAIKPGMPRHFEIPRGNDDNEGGIPKYNRNFRFAGTVVILAVLLLVALTMYGRPPPGARKVGYGGWSVLLIIGGILCIIAFALDVGNTSDAVRCRDREQGNVAFLADKDVCQDYERIMTAATILDLACALLAITTAVILSTAAGQSSKEVGDDFEGARPQGVSKTTKELLLLALVATFVFTVTLLVLTVLMHESRDIWYMDEVYGSREFTNLKPGWPVKNTRLRLAVCGVCIGAALFTLVPFRSRVIAYALAFVLFIASPLAVFVFALDVKAVDDARDLPCPDPWECDYAPYIATCFFDLFLAILLIAYVLSEFITRLAMDVTQLRGNLQK